MRYHYEKTENGIEAAVADISDFTLGYLMEALEPKPLPVSDKDFYVIHSVLNLKGLEDDELRWVSNAIANYRATGVEWLRKRHMDEERDALDSKCSMVLAVIDEESKDRGIA